MVKITYKFNIFLRNPRCLVLGEANRKEVSEFLQVGDRILYHFLKRKRENQIPKVIPNKGKCSLIDKLFLIEEIEIKTRPKHIPVITKHSVKRSIKRLSTRKPGERRGRKTIIQHLKTHHLLSDTHLLNNTEN